MKARICSLVLLLLTLCFSINLSFGATVLYEDKFTNLDPGWGTPSDVMYVKDGKFEISPQVNNWQAALNQGFLVPGDLDVSVGLTYLKASDPDYGSGLVFWAKDTNDFYVLAVNSAGWYAVQRYTANRYIMPVTWRETDAAKKGEGVDNKLRVVTKGNRATVYINDKEVISFTGQPPQGGSFIGFKGSSGPKGVNTAAFSNLQVLQP